MLKVVEGMPRLEKDEYGDFQTPQTLSHKLCRVLKERGVQPRSIIEPTCGVGSFLDAARTMFASLRWKDSQLFGLDINPEYVTAAAELLVYAAEQVEQGDVFQYDWDGLIARMPEPVLILGNPPWVLSPDAETNLPDKSNVRGLRGIDAMTGRGVFDVAEWIIMRMFFASMHKDATLAFICKTSTARKVLQQLWQNGHPVGQTCIYPVDAKSEFGVSVDACFFVVNTQPPSVDRVCSIRDESDVHVKFIGMQDGLVLSDVEQYQRAKEGYIFPYSYKWRSGIQHGLADIMELAPMGSSMYRNGLGEEMELEDTRLYPMLKCTDIIRGREPSRVVILTQTRIAEPMHFIQQDSPKLWDYLNNHGEFFDRRGSSVFKGRGRFAIFGVGDYAMTPWKSCVSGLHKSLNFRLVGPYQGKPVMFDSTCYFLPYKGETEARMMHELVDSPKTHELLSSMMFADNKRPVNSEILNRLSLLGNKFSRRGLAL